MAYSTTPKHGKVARLEKDDVAVDFTSGWNLNFSVDMADTSRQGQNWKNGLPGQGGFTGDMSGHLVLGNTEQKALHDALVAAVPGTKLTGIKWLIDGSTEGWSGDCYVTNYSVNAQVGDKVAVTIQFQGDGAPTLSDAQ